MGEYENVDLHSLYEELKYIREKVDHLEEILIPEVEMTKEDKEELAEAMREHKEGKTIDFRKIRKD